MSKYTIQVKTTSDDTDVISNTTTSVIDFSPTGNYHSFESHLWQKRDFFHLTLSNTIVDLYRLASSVYITDKVTPRNTAFDKWTRDILIYFPVHDVALWERNATTVNKLLSFLTGDHWQIIFQQDSSFVPRPDERQLKKGHPLSVESVTLFSGGLDSFIGSVDSIVYNQSTALVAHTDHAHISNTQLNLFNKLKNRFASKNIELIQFFLQPRDSQENTTRSRSMLFLTLGTLIASATNTRNLLVPENGLISLNVPLTYGRLGSLSTKTTHPYTLSLYNELLKDLGIDVTVVNPYQFKTKGEMLEESKDFDFLRAASTETMSCSHSTAARWEGKPSNKHCGYCLPCLIRRAAFYKNRLDDPNQYSYDIHDADFTNQDSDKSNDVRAILYALESRNDTSSVAKVIKTGPLYPKTAIDNFAGLYERGIIELEKLITQQ
jgi:hypothetical protein